MVVVKTVSKLYVLCLLTYWEWNSFIKPSHGAQRLPLSKYFSEIHLSRFALFLSIKSKNRITYLAIVDLKLCLINDKVDMSTRILLFISGLKSANDWRTKFQPGYRGSEILFILCFKKNSNKTIQNLDLNNLPCSFRCNLSLFYPIFMFSDARWHRPLKAFMTFGLTNDNKRKETASLWILCAAVFSENGSATPLKNILEIEWIYLF